MFGHRVSPAILPLALAIVLASVGGAHPASPTSEASTSGFGGVLKGYTSGSISLGPPGGSPYSVVYDAASDTAWVSSGTSVLYEVSLANLSLVSTVDVGVTLWPGPEALALDPAAGDLLAVTMSNSLAAVSLANHSDVRLVPVGSEPEAVLYAPASYQVLVANDASSGISILNGTTLDLVSSFATVFPTALAFDPTLGEVIVAGAYGFTGFSYVSGWAENGSNIWIMTPPANESSNGPSGLIFDPLNNRVYVTTNLVSNNVLAIDPTNGTIVETIPVGSSPISLALAPTGDTLFVTDWGSNSVTVVNVSASSPLVSTVTVGGEPQGLTYATASNQVVVADGEGFCLSAIDVPSLAVLPTIPLSWGPRTVTFVPQQGQLYAAGGMSLFAVNATTLRPWARVDVGQYPQSIVYDPLNQRLFVTNGDSNTLSVVSAARLAPESNRSVGAFPIGATYDIQTRSILVTLGGSDLLEEISVANATVLRSVTVGSFPAGVILDPAVGEIFVTNFGDDTVSVVSDSTFRVVRTINLDLSTYAAPAEPGLPTLDPNNGEIFVPDRGTGNVSVISDTSLSVIATRNVPVTAYDAVYDPVTDRVYVSDPAANSVAVIDPNSLNVTGSLTAGNAPYGISCDPQNGTVYVANEYSDNITYFTPAFPGTKPAAATAALVYGTVGISILVGVTSALYVWWRSRSARRTESGSPSSDRVP